MGTQKTFLQRGGERWSILRGGRAASRRYTYLQIQVDIYICSTDRVSPQDLSFSFVVEEKHREEKKIRVLAPHLSLRLLSSFLLFSSHTTLSLLSSFLSLSLHRHSLSHTLSLSLSPSLPPSLSLSLSPPPPRPRPPPLPPSLSPSLPLSLHPSLSLSHLSWLPPLGRLILPAASPRPPLPPPPPPLRRSTSPAAAGQSSTSSEPPYLEGKPLFSLPPAPLLSLNRRRWQRTLARARHMLSFEA